MVVENEENFDEENENEGGEQTREALLTAVLRVLSTRTA